MRLFSSSVSLDFRTNAVESNTEGLAHCFDACVLTGREEYSLLSVFCILVALVFCLSVCFQFPFLVHRDLVEQ